MEYRGGYARLFASSLAIIVVTYWLLMAHATYLVMAHKRHKFHQMETAARLISRGACLSTDKCIRQQKSATANILDDRSDRS